MTQISTSKVCPSHDGEGPIEVAIELKTPGKPATMSVIYFVRIGKRIKIGFTTNLAQRLKVFRKASRPPSQRWHARLVAQEEVNPLLVSVHGRGAAQRHKRSIDS